jgi:A/G-specific adenine glycosylase
LELTQALEQVQKWGLTTEDILRQTERSHIFTHIRWEMRGIYMEVTAPGGEFTWLSPEEIEKGAALPTAFRQFWEEL